MRIFCIIYRDITKIIICWPITVIQNLWYQLTRVSADLTLMQFGRWYRFWIYMYSFLGARIMQQRCFVSFSSSLDIREIFRATFYRVNVQAFRNFRHVWFGYARPRNALFNVTLISEVYMLVRSQKRLTLSFFFSDQGHFPAVINR